MNQRRLPFRALPPAAAALCVAVAGASAQAQTIPDLRTGLPDPARTPEATFEQRIDPLNRWTLRLYVDPAAGDSPRGGMEARFLTQRFTAHDLQAGAAVAWSSLQPGPIEPWQSIDERASALFVEDRLRWSSNVAATAGARLVGARGDVGVHSRLGLAWQPAAAWTVNVTDGVVQPLSIAAPNVSAVFGARRYRGVELQTEHTAGILQVRARAASQQVVSGLEQSQLVHAAAVSLALPVDGRWSVGTESMLSTQGDQTRFKVSGSWIRERATVSLLVPYRFGARPVDPALNAGLPFVEPDDGLGWRAQLELRF